MQGNATFTFFDILEASVKLFYFCIIFHKRFFNYVYLSQVIFLKGEKEAKINVKLLN